MSPRYCITIPHYRHGEQLLRYLPKLESLGLPIIIVDDGSDAETRKKLKRYTDTHNILLLEHVENRGKGAAVFTAAYAARARGYTHIIQIDADGQHNADDIPKFISLSREHSGAIISGKPVFAKDAPLIRVYGRKITLFWVALESFSFAIKDGLCGFRCYPLAEFERVTDRYYIGKRMDFDTDILTKSCWLNIPIYFVDTKVCYPEGNVSHFYYLRDNLLLIKLHTRLMLGMLIRSPLLLLNKLFIRKKSR